MASGSRLVQVEDDDGERLVSGALSDFRWVESLLDVFDERGWKVTHNPQSLNWELFWSNIPSLREIFSAGGRMRLTERQLISHHSNHYELTRKDLMYRNYKRYRKAKLQKGEWAPDILPLTFYLPQDYSLFANEFRKIPDSTWIVKPVGKAQGKGIFLVNRLQQLNRFRTRTHRPGGLEMDDTYIISRYVDPPMLIGGRKFDLRLYVLVTSVRPMKAYLHENGFARFCSIPYDASYEGDIALETKEPVDLRASTLPKRRKAAAGGRRRPRRLDVNDLTRHLTNVSLQKHTADYNEEHGGKWPLENFRMYIEGTRGAEAAAKLFAEMRSMIYHSLKGVRDVLTPDAHCFELFGYDILIDSDLRPWLVEVNASPAMSSTTDADHERKVKVLRDTMTLVLRDKTIQFRQGGVRGLNSSTWRQRRRPQAGGRTRGRRPQRPSPGEGEEEEEAGAATTAGGSRSHALTGVAVGLENEDWEPWKEETGFIAIVDEEAEAEAAAAAAAAPGRGSSRGSGSGSRASGSSASARRGGSGTGRRAAGGGAAGAAGAGGSYAANARRSGGWK